MTGMAEPSPRASVALNEVDLAPFRKATEGVWDAWEKKPVGEFVKRLRKTRA